MKSKFIRIVNLIVAAAVFVFAIGYVFAWLAESRRQSEQNFNGSSGQTYFAGGNGEKGDPFIINDKYHLYNLAWLQNTGKFVDKDGKTPKKYYFALDKNVNIIDDNFWLPPIGTDDNPFIGEFDGRGYTISGLKITTDRSKLLGVPSGFTTFSNAVGLFGMTKKQDGETEGAVIHNFILENPIVEVAAQNAPYSTAETGKNVAGLAIGYLNEGCKASSIGILSKENEEGTAGAQLLMYRASGYSTFNSIIGALGNNVTSSVTGGGHGTGGSGSSFGASFDVDGLLTRLTNIYTLKYGKPYAKGKDYTPLAGMDKLPAIDTSSDNPVPAKGYKVPFTVNLSPTSEKPYEEISKNNIGYVIGNQNKIQSKTLYFGDKLIDPKTYTDNWYTLDSNGNKVTPAQSEKVPRWFYTYTTPIRLSGTSYAAENGFRALSETEFNNLPEGVKNLIADENTEQIKYSTLRLQNPYYLGNEVNKPVNIGVNNSKWAFQGQISWYGKTYGEGFNNNDNVTVDENVVRYAADGNKLDAHSYKYNEQDGYFIKSSNWTTKVFFADENGYAQDENGHSYFRYKTSGDSDTYINGFIDETGHFYNEDGYLTNKLVSGIYKIDSEGYALTNDDKYIDTLGGVSDELGFVTERNNAQSYYADISGYYPLNTCTIDEDGYYVHNGERYKDEDGKNIRAYGYGIATDDNINYYLTLNGEKFTIKQYNTDFSLSPKKLQKAKVLNADDLIKSYSGSYIEVQKGESVSLSLFKYGIYMPNDVIWFKPSVAGVFRIVMYTDKADETFSLAKVVRKSADKTNPFYTDPDNPGVDITAEILLAQMLSPYILTYYEVECTQDDIDKGNIEYFLSGYNNNGALFLYLDIGASAAEDNSTYDPNVKVSAVDFIYEGVEIAQEEKTIDGAKISVGDFILSTSGEPYKATQTSVYFENLNKILAIVYVRPNGGTGKNNNDPTDTNDYTIFVTATVDGEVKQTREPMALIQ